METQTIESNKMTLPKGGGAYQGLGGELNVDLFSGSGSLRIPIETSDCRGGGPKLSLNYNTAGGNGVFGMGFALEIPSVTRRTGKRIPKYDDTDVFVLSGSGELTRVDSIHTPKYIGSECYRQRYESNFEEILHYTEDGNSMWKVTDKNQTVSVFGESRQSQVVDPNREDRIFCWNISSRTDRFGNRTCYEYDENHNISRIRYGNYRGTGQKEEWLFGVEFTYEKGRCDSFRRYNSGFLIETDVLCTEIAIVHYLTSGCETVRRIRLSYDRTSGISLLQKVSVEGCRRRTDGTTEILKEPDLQLSYTTFQRETLPFHKLEVENGQPFCINSSGYSLIDLYGDGIAGILYAEKNMVFYCRPLGKFRFAAPRVLKEFPVYRSLSGNSLNGARLTSIEGNGRYQLVVHTPSADGYFELEEDGTWGAFREFPQITREWENRYCEEADLQGDKLMHLMISDGNGLHYYPSGKKKGCLDPTACKIPEGFPQITENGPEEVVSFQNIFGDGLSHRVRVKNGSVECFPNLGYGRFGNRVEIPGAPVFEEGFNAARLFFADVDGSGITDLVYVYQDHIDLYRNRGEAGFSEPESIPLPEAYTDRDHIAFGDVTGTGTECMIFSKMDREVRHYCLDFASGKKPYLLCKIDNGMGAVTELTHQSSVEVALQDQREGKTWEQKPPFPVQLVTKRRIYDDISKNEMITEYHYRNGLYDFEENEFKGFGQIDQMSRQKNAYWEEEQEPILVRKWFDIGIDQSMDYNKKDKMAIEMASPILEVSQGNIWAAEKALWGRPLREETYGRDTENPVDVVEYAYRVKELLPMQEGKAGSYFTSTAEQVHYHYEGNGTDPVTTHKFYLELDEYGNILRECKVHYPRRKEISLSGTVPEELAKKQRKLRVTETVRTYAVCREGARLLELPAEERRYQVEGLFVESYFTMDEIKAQLNTAAENRILYGETFEVGKKQEQLVHFTRNLYWDSTGKEVLDCGMTGIYGLKHHEEAAVFPDGFVEDRGWFGSETLREECGYHFQNGHWWKRSDTVSYYGKEKFFLERCMEMERPFRRICTDYDSFCLFSVIREEFVDSEMVNVTTALVDYQALQYCHIVDPNGNVEEARFDALGRMIVHTAYGTTEGVYEGDGEVAAYEEKSADLKAVLHDPEAFLQEMTEFYYYDGLAYEERREPICSVYLSKKNSVSSQKESVIGCQLSYWDGLGQIAEEKHRYNETTWIMKHKTIYDGIGKEIFIYPPCFTDCFRFEPHLPSLPPVRKYYDCLGRLVKTETPDNQIPDMEFAYLYSKTEYHSWEIREYDENQCLKDSVYYQEFVNRYPKEPDRAQQDKMKALKKTVQSAGQGRIHILDNKGSRIGEILDEEGGFVEYGYDGCRHLVTVTDDRLRSQNIHNLVYIRDMLGNILLTDSCDGGRSVSITDNHGCVVREITAEGVQKRTTYDGLQRILEVWVNERLSQRRRYGEDACRSEDRNLRGRLLEVCDQAGVERYEAYTIWGKIRTKNRQFCHRYDIDIDWSEENPLEDGLFEETFHYNTAGDITERLASDQTHYFYRYDSLGLLQNICVEKKEETTKSADLVSVIDEIRYNADGKRLSVHYGNGVTSTYRYNKVTGRPETMRTERQDKSLIQYLSYTYDPIGNITCIRDDFGEEKIVNGQRIEPAWEYEYDKFYRLIKAEGREQAGHSNDFSNLAGYRREYTYDTGGNLLRIRHDSPTGNHVTDMEMEQGSNRMKKAGRQAEEMKSFSYGQAGNMISLPSIHRLDWSQEGMLTHAVVIRREDEENDEEFYVYDSSGERVRKVSRRKIGNGCFERIEKFYLNGYVVKRVVQEFPEGGRQQAEQLISEYTGMNLSSGESIFAVVYHFSDVTQKLEIGNKKLRKIRYMVENHIHAVSVELDESARLISYEEYYPYGETALLWKSKAGESLKEYRFCGKEKDSVTGMYYYGSRYYHPLYARMISADDAIYVKEQDWQTINLYAYCQNNPVVRTDPSGNCATFIFHGEGQAGKAKVEGRMLSPNAQVISIFPPKKKPGSISEVSNQDAFTEKWAAMDSRPDSTIVIYQHGRPTGIVGIPLSAMNTGKAASELILFSCNTASPTNIRTFNNDNPSYVPANTPPPHNVAQRALLTFPNIERVIGTRGFHVGFASGEANGHPATAVHNAVTESEGHRVEGLRGGAAFIMYTRDAANPGGIVETRLGNSYSGISQLVRHARDLTP